MANYPKITGNSNASKLDRPIGLDKTNFFQIKLTDSVSEKEYIYGVVIVESKGDPGSSVSISDMHIKDSDSVNMSTHEVSGSRSNTTIQDAYFTLSPLQKVSGGWTADKPFMGVVKADLTTEKVKTANWAVVAGSVGLPQAYYDAVGDGPSTYIKVNKTSGEIDGILDATTAFAEAEYIIPIYNHAFIEANPLQAGEYAAVLIKCDVTKGIFDGEKQNTLSISHDSIIHNSATNQNYSIKLQVNGENLFIFGSTFVGVDFTNEGSVSSPSMFRTIKHITTDGDTGTSWHARDTTNPLHTLVYNEEDNLIHVGALFSFTLAGPGSSFFTGTLTNYYDDADILTAWNANGYAFEEATLSVYDASALAMPFNFFPNPGSNKFFIAADTDIKYNDTSNIDGVSSFTFKHNTKTSSSVYENGTITATSVIDSEGNGDSLYPNFSATSDITSESLSIRGTQGDTVIDKTVTANFLVYPQFTYGTTAISLYDKPSNLETNNDKPINAIVHANDTYVKLNTLASKYCPIVDEGKIYKNSDGNTSGIMSKHNVRINVLNDEDVIGQHALASPNAYYRGSGTVKAFTATNENTVLADTSGAAETTAVPTTSNKFLDYTIETTESNYTANNISTYESFAKRTASGAYEGMDLNGGFYTISEEFRAPITNWQPGYRHGQTWGAQRIPYYYSVYATGKTYKTKGAYYVPRPLLHIAPLSNTSGVGTNLVKRLEFVGAPGTTPVINNINLGLTNFASAGTAVYRQDGADITCSASTNRDRITDFANDAGTNANSQIAGAEVFGLTEFFGDRRLFVASYTPVSGGKGYTTLVLEDGTPAQCIKTQDSAGITPKFGKPTHSATVKRANFPFTDSLATAQLRSRVFRPYGYDLTCSINIGMENVIPTDVFVPVSVSDSTSASASHAGSTTVVNSLYTAIENGVSGAKVDILTLEPKELGITFGGSTEIESARFYGADGADNFARREGTDIPVFYKNIGASSVINSAYKTVFSFDLFNLGLEDVLIKSVDLFDPLYIPEGNFTIKPASSGTPTFAISAANYLDRTGNLSEFKAVDLNGPNLGKVSSGLFLKRTSKEFLEETVTGYTASNTNIEVSFSVSQANAAGSFFKALEIEYYRDEGITQNKKIADGSFVQREIVEKRVWTTRVLLQVEVEQASAIQVADTDGTVVLETGSLDFGTIIA
jgi:hypothetical protein